MTARLKQGANVVLHSPINGQRHLFVGGDVLPVWAVKLIADDAGVVETDTKAGDKPPADVPIEPKGSGEAGGDPVDPDASEGGEGGGDPVTPDEPPRKGAGSGKAAWHTYAEQIGVTVPEGASAAEVQAAVDAAKG